jgi:hypothetical protein
MSSGNIPPSQRTCGEPYVVINYKGSDKEMIFPCGTEVEKFGLVYIQVEKGFFGYDIITNKTLIEGQW